MDSVQLREHIEARLKDLAAQIGATGYDVVGFDRGIDAGYPYIQIDDDGLLNWIVKDRGCVITHQTTRDIDELLYWCFESTTSGLASDWERRHRVPDVDNRIAWWAKQAELLWQLKPQWAQRWRAELLDEVPDAADLMPTLPSDIRGRR